MKDKSILISMGIIIYIIMSGIDRFVYHIPVSYTHLRSTAKGISVQCSCGDCQSRSRYGITKNLYGCRCGLVCKGRGYCIEE